MASFIYYIIALVISGAIFALNLYLGKKSTKGYTVWLKILSILFGVVFTCRYMLGEDAISGMHALGDTPLSATANAFALFLVWFTYAGNLLLTLFGFFRIPRLVQFVKYISTPMSILNFVFMWFAFSAIIGPGAIDEITVRGVFFAAEVGLALGYSLSIFYQNSRWFEKREKLDEPQNQVVKYKHITSDDDLKIITAKDRWVAFCHWFYRVGLGIARFFRKYWFDIFAVLIVFLAVMPAYTMEGLFGDIHMVSKAKGLEFAHRVILYIGIILPVILHFTLRKKEYSEKKFYLLYICLGTLLSFSLNHKFVDFLDPTLWPLHLCNTAMYIMPIVLIFNMKRFFYFTYFINVLGAFLAMVMPNYSPSTINIFDTGLCVFYINHYIAFFMPLLFVSLGMFERPKFKQFVYSMLGFLAYFVLVLILNAMFTGMYVAGMVSRSTDFFFINSDFIADKLGTWAENLRDITAVITIGGIEMVFYPVYQVLFFIVYVLLGLAVWFVYEQGYAIANSFEDMKQRKKAIKMDKLALLSKLDGRSLTEPMEPENANKLILRNFSKKYASSSVYAVEDANLVVEGGTIFGFLGPNGAGKSTIIKSIVGIQPITSGQIEVCGFDVDRQSVESKRQIGFVPDHYALYEKLTGREYINYIADLYEVPLAERTARIDNYVERFELTGAFDNQIKTYSHGMKQKIAIMAALVHNPRVWILDEPLTGLDPNSIYQVKECMKEHARAGNIVFFSSHIIDVVERICDKIAIIKKGKVLLTKSLAEIEASGTTLEDFYMTTINGEGYAKKINSLGEEIKGPMLFDSVENAPAVTDTMDGTVVTLPAPKKRGRPKKVVTQDGGNTEKKSAKNAKKIDEKNSEKNTQKIAKKSAKSSTKTKKSTETKPKLAKKSTKNNKSEV